MAQIRPFGPSCSHNRSSPSRARSAFMRLSRRGDNTAVIREGERRSAATVRRKTTRKQRRNAATYREGRDVPLPPVMNHD